MSELTVIAIIVAGGKGLRMNSDIPKQYLTILDKPILSHTISVFEKINRVNEIILAIPNGDIGFCQDNVLKPFHFKKTIHLVAGGNSRNDSVFNCLDYVNKSGKNLQETIVLIHDGVRPLVDETIIADAIENAGSFGAAIPVIPLTDTLKKSKKGQKIKKTINRENLFLAQTPQAFRFELIFNAFAHARVNYLSGTDDASLVEQMGGEVYMFSGSKRNIKITTIEDMDIAAFYLNRE